MKSGIAQQNRRSQWAFMEVFRIPNFDTDEWYLTRWRIIQTPWFSIFLHKIATPDSRPTLHDHPWSFVSMVLRGGYVEDRLNLHTLTRYTRHTRRINIMRRGDFHSIMSLDGHKPTWTLLLVGARRQTWGYLRPGVADGQWTWTEFDKDQHSLEYDNAMHRRMK